jgi:chromate transporter
MLTVFLVFLRLGLTSFGGPVAHLGYFRAEFVARRRWLDEAAYADLVGLSQLLPGPASSQVAMAIGLGRAGMAGAVAAWIGFTAPSAMVMLAAAYGVADLDSATAAPWLHGLRVVAVAVVALAVWTMARTLVPDRIRASIAVIAAVIALAIPTALGQMGVIALGGMIGWATTPPVNGSAATPTIVSRSDRRRGAVALVLFAGLLLGLPAFAVSQGSQALRLFDAFYRSGALVFGGGHVVLPLLRAEVVPQGWVGDNAFLAGYGFAQAMPGPLFSFATYLGALSAPEPNGWLGGLIAIVAIYLPSFLLVIGVLPFWAALRGMGPTRSALAGINAAVVGLLLAALYDPVWTTTIHSSADFALAAVALLLLALWKAPPWLVVLLGGLGGYALDRFGAILG